MVKQLGDIKSIDWSPKLGEPGEVVERIADIEQCMRIIVSTPKGSLPHRPDFGCDAARFLDAPVSEVPALLEVLRRAILKWEPRVKSLALSFRAEGEQVFVQTKWTLNVEGRTLENSTALTLARTV